MKKLRLFKKPDLVCFMMYLNGKCRMFEDKSEMFKFIDKYSDDNHIETIALYRCKLYNLKND